MGYTQVSNKYDRRMQARLSWIQKDMCRCKPNKSHAQDGQDTGRYTNYKRKIQSRHGAGRYSHEIQPVKNLVRRQGESFVAE